MSKKQAKAPISNIAPQLREYVDRIEKLAEEKKEVGDAINDIFREAKSNGLHPKSLREIIKLRKLDSEELAESEFHRDNYMRALGLMADLV
jgi:uncharacterized protein (UPF0335 family)